MAKSGKEWVQGIYTLKNPDKYLGDPDKVIFRSSWEQEAFKILDLNPKVVAWASEEIAIPYPKPLPDGTGDYTIAQYYPDLFVAKEETNGDVTREIIEIKPYKQTQASRARKPQQRLQEEYELIVNRHKWAAAEKWCKQYGITFRIMTEKDMFI